jgi:hypothetical protein
VSAPTEAVAAARACSRCAAPIGGQPPVVAETMLADVVVGAVSDTAVSDAAGKAVTAGVARQAPPEPYISRVPALASPRSFGCDGGKTWQRLPINDPQEKKNLEGVGFIGSQVGWVGGGGDALMPTSRFLEPTALQATDRGIRFDYTLPDGARSVWLHVWDRFGNVVRTVTHEEDAAPEVTASPGIAATTPALRCNLVPTSIV